ncbi:MAG: YvcK family protein [Chloroflexi bacterium]|nr:YvcK family protein [Chloroflexota bacterium]MBU1751872.1 YvcK family protein [Chloroflexota bacterium]MBU1879946.1 YvcK family protein [Chloroflexota bacterium]
MRLPVWLQPGLGLKRWLVLLLVGILFISLGLGYLLRQLYDTVPVPDFFYYLTLQFIPREGRILLFLLAGLAVIALALWQMNRSLISALVLTGRPDAVSLVHQRRQLARGPRVVAIGGGTGLSTLLRGLKEHTGNLAAIITVADDGGSSGRLRRELGVLPPGDFRQCIVALADAEPLMTSLFEYRFGDGEPSSLAGHSFGNLFISAMAGVTGDFERALRESGRVLAVRGEILPSTLADVVLWADLVDEAQVEGESHIPRSGVPIARVYLQPDDPPAYAEALRAILEADLIVIGPGSLYTSILPNLLVPDIMRAVRASQAVKVYVCNTATQPGETDGYSVHDHIQAILAHVGERTFDLTLVNENLTADFPVDWRPIAPPRGDVIAGGGRVTVQRADLIDQARPWRHDSIKLARAIMALYYQHTNHVRKRPWSRWA